jgi:uncharacterized protein DUF2793/endosialidase-like protein
VAQNHTGTGPDGMDTTPNLSLPFIAAAQAQKHVTHNEALRALDAVVQLMVLDKDLAAPPGSPTDGARYIVAASPTGAWAGQPDRIAAWQDGAWAFYVPHEGWLAWVADEDALYAWSGTAWTSAAGRLSNLLEDATPQLGGDLDANGHGIAFDDGTGLTDDSGNEQLVLHKAAGAVNWIGIANAPTGTAPQLAAEGTDPNIDLRLTPKGTGVVRSAGQMFVGSAGFPPLRMERTTGATAIVVGGQQFLATSSGNMLDGFGVNVNFAIQDNAVTVNEIGNIAFSRSGADNSGRFQVQPYNAGTPVTRLEIAPGGNVYFPGVGTTASAANAVLNNGSSPTNELLRSTSSVRYKTDILDIDVDWQHVVRALRPITYRSTATADDPSKRWFGLIAEEVAEIEPRLVHYTPDKCGNESPESVQYDRLTVLLLKVVQELLKRYDLDLGEM